MHCVLVLRKAEHRLAYTTTFQGLPVSIENRKGSIRRGIAADGAAWQMRMQVPYGRLPWSISNDGESCDVFLGPVRDAPEAYIIRTLTPPEYQVYDEDKIFLGYASLRDAQVCFLDHYKDPRRMGYAFALDMATFKQRLRGTLFQPGAIPAS
jgi:hypothetical protein